jgi:hypothetical protein
MLLILTFFIPIHLRADCGVERLPVKVASDPDAGLISAGSVIPTTILGMRSLSTVRPLPQDRRVSPVETTIYSVTATLIEYKLEDDGDYYLVLSDEAGRTIIAEIPSPACLAGSRFAFDITSSRHTFEGRLPAAAGFRQVRIPSSC